MITKVSKNVVCIKDIPSNLIEEAIFILKGTTKENEEIKNTNKKSKEFILKEAEEIIMQYNTAIQEEIDVKRRNEKIKKIREKKLKVKALFYTTLFIITCLIISICTK